MSKKLPRFMLVDGNALVHRAYHALPPLTTKKGELVNAVYGFTTLLLKAIQDLKPEYVAVAFDLAGPTFRHEQYKEYKATRAKAPDELYAQFDRVKEVVSMLNIPIFGVKGFEADDVIGTLAQQAAKQGIETFIVTGDMDTLQLVNQFVKIYTMRRGITDTVIYDTEAVVEKYGLNPDQFVDFKALKGDASDNIPGVDGIGEKTASLLISGLGSLDKLYAWLEEHKADDKLPDTPVKITPRIRDILLQGKERAYLSQDLSRIICDVDISLDLKAAIIKDYDRQKTIELFQDLEFRSLLVRLPDVHDKANPVSQARSSATAAAGTAAQGALFTDESSSKPVTTQVANAKYILVKTEKQFNELLGKLKKATGFVVDTETDYLNGPVIGLSFAVEAGEAYYVPTLPDANTKLLRQDSDAPSGATKRLKDASAFLKNNELFAALKPILEDPHIAKYGHNMKYDYLALRKEGITLAPLSFDTMIASYLLNPNNRQHGLDAVAFVELGVEKIPLAELIGVKKLDSLKDVAVEKVAEYACEDADVTFRLWERFAPQLKQEHVKKVFEELEMPLVPILGAMEEEGIKIDADYLQQLSKRQTKRTEELTNEIYAAAGQEFNINSPSQLSVVLFDKLKLTHPFLKKTKTGISTAASELEKLKGLHPIIDLLFEYRELTKLLSTYIDVLPNLADKQSRIHTSYSQTIAATGRLASNDPNLQNIPIRTESGREVRAAFVAEKGHKLVSADYSQIELRVVAHLAGDEALATAFQEDRDIHQEVADTLGVDRRVGKTLNFAVLYGQGAYSTAGQLGIPMVQAKEYIDQYFQTYAGVRRFLDETLAQARAKGYVETIFGRRRYIPEILSSNFAIRGGAERIATNMPIQGSAADLMKLAMINVAGSERIQELGAKLLLQVHDELVFEAPEAVVPELAKEVKKIMENVYELKVPLKAEVKVGDGWGEMTPQNLA